MGNTDNGGRNAEMKHLGDISKIRGGEIPVVDVIIGGSPCQDLSVAGKRAGLDGERSGLFLEQIRVIKEMREHDRRTYRTGQFVRPRYAVWENVAGACSCPGKDHAGEDFAAVLTEFTRIAEPEAPAVAVPDKGWPMAGCLYGADGSWSVAWRLFDAQFWGPTLTADGRVLAAGTPQRRQRVALVADFGGITAPEILFEREGLHRDPAAGGETGQEAAGETADRSGTDDRGRIIAVATQQGGAEISENGICPTVTATAGMSGNNQPWICSGFSYKAGAKAAGIGYESEKGPTLSAQRHDAAVTYDARGNGDGQAHCTMTGDHQRRVTDYTGLVVEKAWGIGNGQAHCAAAPTEEIGWPIDCMHDAQAVLTESGRAEYTVRRLTPMECERLQGFPDNWTKLPIIEEMSEEDFRFYDDIRREAARVFGKSYKTPSREGMVKWWNKMAASDGHRYQSLGDSICLPGWKWICKRICAQYERDATLGSLFDGIGGFPLIWERLNGRGMCLWASEVEPFQIAVTRTRFRAEEIGKWL